jgi:hypothetical protein
MANLTEKKKFIINKNIFLIMISIKHFLLIVLILVSCQFFSQPGPPAGPNCWPPPCIPIDGGIGIFTFISMLFGYKLVSKNK